MISMTLSGDGNSDVYTVPAGQMFVAGFRVRLNSGSATVALQQRDDANGEWATYESQGYTATGGEGVNLMPGDYRINVSGSSSPTGTARLVREFTA